MDFQTLNNAEVFIMDAELNYPVTAHTLYSYITEPIISLEHLVVINSDHPEEIAREEAIKEEGDEYTAKLDDPDYKDAPATKAEDSW